jgi:hypothetical protein
MAITTYRNPFLHEKISYHRSLDPRPRRGGSRVCECTDFIAIAVPITIFFAEDRVRLGMVFDHRLDKLEFRESGIRRGLLQGTGGRFREPYRLWLVI